MLHLLFSSHDNRQSIVTNRTYKIMLMICSTLVTSGGTLFVHIAGRNHSPAVVQLSLKHIRTIYFNGTYRKYALTVVQLS